MTDKPTNFDPIKMDRLEKAVREILLAVGENPDREGLKQTPNRVARMYAELFQGLYIYDKWDWEKTCPVIRLSFSEMSYRELGLKKALELCLAQQAETHGICLETTSYDQQFLELIKKVGNQTQVAVLIDEYDKPIIDYLEKSAFKQAQENREILKTFYAGVKDQDKYLRFFVTTQPAAKPLDRSNGLRLFCCYEFQYSR